MRNIICLMFLTVCLIACKSKSEQKPITETESTALVDASIKKIDVHSHYEYSRTYFPALFQKWNMQSVLVDVAIEDTEGIERSWDGYTKNAKANPNLFYLCSSLIGNGIDASDFAEKAIAQLGQEIDSGALMVKVWKNFGMVTKDNAGNFIQIDDARLQPIWDFLSERKIPVMAHIGEPVQAWRPLDDPNNPHYGYYKNNPQYHAYMFPDIPTYETIISARDQWIENNPSLSVLCAHIGSMSHNVDMVAERLDKYPNMQVELAARFGDLARQDSKKVAQFFDKYQDRILFGSDYGNGSQEDTMTEDELKAEQENLDTNYQTLWDYLSGTDSLTVRGQKTKGLGLTSDILNKIYYQNTVNFLSLE
ncbi:amidohydrolase family protein [Spongiimicrobium sp. 3-5]|uniref:amidohydrolase family protein n=1 Tax=Spongiimicrobium sp. 3-5 TaxID=3332596 RepID=UPI0039807A0F